MKLEMKNEIGNNGIKKGAEMKM